MNRLGSNAVVIGGSIAGLIAARALSDYFDQVTILERDHIEDQPALHKSIPQGNHLHALLLGGQQVLTSFYPGFTDKLSSLGSVRIRTGRDVAFHLPDGKAYIINGAVREPRDLGFDSFAQSRGLLEYCLRQFTLEIPNIRFESRISVQGLVYEDKRVQGVRYNDEGGSDYIEADFVVEAAGRGSHAPRWIAELGFMPPEETSIGVDFAYASTKFRIPDYYQEPEKMIGFFGPAPNYANCALMEEIEQGLWHLSLAGRFGDYPPTDEAGFLAFARSLHTPKLYELIKGAERVAEITPYRFPASLLRHYERLDQFPDRFIVLGDAICSFNPIYGQGMSSAALQVRALHESLNRRADTGVGLDGLAQEFFPKAAEVIATPWTLAAAFDLAYPQTKGERSSEMAKNAEYFAALNTIIAEDIDVHRLLVEVIQLARPLTDLREEPLRSRVEARLQKSVMA